MQLKFTLTENSYNLVVLNDLQWPRDHKAQRIQALSGVIDEVAWGAVGGLELDGQGAEAAVAGQPEGRVLVEDFPVQVHTDIGPHVLGADGENLQSGEQDNWL